MAEILLEDKVNRFVEIRYLIISLLILKNSLKSHYPLQPENKTS